MVGVSMDTNQSKRPKALTFGGITLGVLIGVVLSLVLDTWAYMGVGIGRLRTDEAPQAHRLRVLYRGVAPWGGTSPHADRLLVT